MTGRYVSNPTEDDYAAAAAWAVEEGKFDLALEQIGAALSFAPLSVRNLRQLESILARTPNHPPPSGEGPRFFGAMAVRAEILARRGRMNDAVSTLLSVVAFRPAVPYLPWVVRWLAGRSLRGIRATEMSAGFAKVVQAFDATRPHLQNVEAGVWLLDRLGRERRAAADESAVLGARLLASLPDYEGAERRLREALGRGAGLDVREALASHLRSRGRLEEAVTELEPVLAASPKRHAAWADALEVLCELELSDDVLRRVEEAEVASWPSATRDTVEACRAFAIARTSPDPSAPRRALEEIGARAAAPTVAKRLLSRLGAYRDHVPPLLCPIADVVRSALRSAASRRPSSPLRLRIRADRPISPSAAQALASGLAELDLDGEIEGAALPAAYEAPTDASNAMVVSLMLGSTPLPSWIDDGPGLHADEAVRVLARPPSPPCGRDPVDRLHIAQIATLCLLARSARKDEHARALLLDCARADDSWLAASALVVLGLITERTDDALREAALEVLGEVRRILGAGTQDPRALPLAVFRTHR